VSLYALHQIHCGRKKLLINDKSKKKEARLFAEVVGLVRIRKWEKFGINTIHRLRQESALEL
jgi:hypothetical protein